MFFFVGMLSGLWLVSGFGCVLLVVWYWVCFGLLGDVSGMLVLFLCRLPLEVSVCPGWCVPSVAGCPVWCVPCGVVVRRALRLLPTAYAALGELRGVAAASPPDAVRVSGSRPRRSPSVAVDTADELFRLACFWEDDLRRFLGHGAAHDSADRAVTLAAAVEYLNRNFAVLMARPDCAGVFGGQVSAVFSTVLRMVKNGPLRAWSRVPCPWCGRRCLMQQEGLALRPWFTVCLVGAGGCGRLLSEEEMEWLVQDRLPERV